MPFLALFSVFEASKLQSSESAGRCGPFPGAGASSQYFFRFSMIIVVPNEVGGSRGCLFWLWILLLRCRKSKVRKLQGGVGHFLAPERPRSMCLNLFLCPRLAWFQCSPAPVETSGEH